MTVTTEKFHNGTGSAHTFDFPFQYLKTADVKVKVGGVLKSESTHYNVSNNNVVFTSGNFPEKQIQVLQKQFMQLDPL